MTVDFSSLHKILKDKTRRDILRCLNEKGSLSYVELMNATAVANTGRFNYHLKVLGSLIEKQNDGRYDLTERGRLAVQLLDKFPEKALQTRSVKMKRKRIAVEVALVIVCVIAVSLLLVSLQPKQPSFDVTYWKQETGSGPYSNPNAIQYRFNVTGTHETFQFATGIAIDNALAPYVNRYPFETITFSNGTTVPGWSSEYVHNGQFTFTLFLQRTLTDAQLKSLTQDLKEALKSTQ